jgi:hypothetical protein
MFFAKIKSINSLLVGGWWLFGAAKQQATKESLPNN